MILIVQIAISFVLVLGVGIIFFTNNLIHALYALALVLLGVAGLYVLLRADLVATVQLLIYAGGVIIFLVFGVMLAMKSKEEAHHVMSWNNGLGLMIALIIFIGLSYLVSQFQIGSKNIDYAIEDISLSFLSEHLLAFELIGFILLVALVGAAYLAKKSSNE